MNPEIMNMLNDSWQVFKLLAVELTVLFIAISYLVGIIQEYITPEKIQSILSSKGGRGYIIAAFLGAITPFCSCSTIPFLKGLLRARAGFGPMLVFLFASPLLNPVIIGLFVMTFGWQVALSYFLIALSVSVCAGYILEKLGFQRYVRDEAYQLSSTASCGAKMSVSNSGTKPLADSVCCASEVQSQVETSCCADGTASMQQNTVQLKANRWVKVWRSTWQDFKQVLPYLMLGIVLGSLIYGFVPTDFIAGFAGEGKWWAIPVVAVIGIPLYIRAEAVIPLSAALLQKGMALGSVMALIIGSAGASITEVILLRAIFKKQMIAAFLVVVLGMAMGAGFLYSFIF